MNKQKAQDKQNQYRSFEEYKRRFFPVTPNQQAQTEGDPYTFGVNLAKESLSNLRQSSK